MAITQLGLNGVPRWSGQIPDKIDAIVCHVPQRIASTTDPELRLTASGSIGQRMSLGSDPDERTRRNCC